jgi:hypothetical protein
MADRILSARTINFDGPAVIKGAEAHDIDFSHNAPSNSQKSGEEEHERSRTKGHCACVALPSCGRHTPAVTHDTAIYC